MCRSRNTIAILSLMLSAALQAEERAAANLRDIPVLYETDVVVAGGSCAAVAAACEAAQMGAHVVLIAPRPYLGDDLCGQQRLCLMDGEVPESELAKALFPDGRITTPFTVKRALDRALLKRGIRYLTGCYATDLLVDTQGHPSGVVMINRSGSQAIKAKVVIDGTRHALLARQAGAKFRAFVAGDKELHFTVVGGDMQPAAGLTSHKLDVTYQNPTGNKSAAAYPVYGYIAKMPLCDSSYAAFARAEQTVRDRVCGAGMKACSETATCYPTDTMIGEQRLEGSWPGAARCETGAFRPQGIRSLYVLSEYADVGAEGQPAMLRPLSFLAVGKSVGLAAANEAKSEPRAAEVRLANATDAAAERIAVGDSHNVTAPFAKAGAVKVGMLDLPVLGDYDVVVVGGGTAGAPAGIAAARSGARTLVIEYLAELGGVGTAGLIGSYWYGMRGGFTREVDEAIGAWITGTWSGRRSGCAANY